MQQRLGFWFVLGTGLACVGACSSQVTVMGGGGDDDTIPTTTTHTTPTGSTTTTWSTTTDTWTTTTWTTTTPTCDIDLGSLIGASAPCNQCVGDNCCAEAQAFESALDQDTFNALSYCAVGAQGEGPCMQQCYSPICGNDQFGYALFQACVDCLNASCCDEFNACNDQGSCQGCLWNFNPGCCNNGAFVAWDSCGAGQCQYECFGGYCVNGG
jgi:hypothetical protein